MFLFHNNKFLVILLIELLLLLTENDIINLTKNTTVNANGNTIIPGPLLQIEKPSVTRLIIKEPHLPHYLPCLATIEESDYNHEEFGYFFTWYRNDEKVLITQERRKDFYIYLNGTLRLPPNERASGVYRCKINADTAAVISESITVEYPVLKRPQHAHEASSNITAPVGLSLTINCPVPSVPLANVTWYYGNGSNFVKIPTDNRFLQLVNGSLIVKKLLQSDSGKYKCIAQNLYAAKNQRQFVWSLNVEANQRIAEQNFALLIPHLQNTTQYIPLDGDIKLLCYSLSDFIPIEWWYQRTHHDVPVHLSNHSNEYEIRFAAEIHEGFYTCSTPSDNQTFHLIITEPPAIIDPLPSYESSITVSMSLRCRANGHPKPTITWYHNGERFNSSYTRYINDNELQIHSFDPDEEGIYQCFAQNVAGEVYSAGEIRLKAKNEEVIQKNPLHNIRCFAHSFNTINVTFDTAAVESLLVVYIVQSNPHRWTSPFAPKSYSSFMVISSQLPVYRPFQLITRVLYPTSEIRLGNQPHQQTILSSLRSPPVTCFTQGLLLHLVHIGNDTFVTWSQPDIPTKKYFIIEFSVKYTKPHPRKLLDRELRGTTDHLKEFTADDVLKRLHRIETLNATAAQTVLQNAQENYAEQQDANSDDQDIFSLVVTANVTGILMEDFARIKLRVLIITTENEYLQQDFRYVQWKTIENNTSEMLNSLFHLSTVESRMLVFHVQEIFNESCVCICHSLIQFPIINKEERKCEKRTISNSQVEIRGLKPSRRYHLNFSNCDSQTFYGQTDAQTLPDPPGTISNQRITRHNGLKMSWDPPTQPNGKIHHYNVLWSLGNVTHEVNIGECSPCSYKFPNISESAKINVTVRVVGETGVGAPIFIDLRDINHHTLEIEHSDADRAEVYSGIAIGLLLSSVCVCCFAAALIYQHRRFKARHQGPTHLTTPSDVTFGNLSNTGIPADSAGGLSGSTLQQDCHEMQTLIPKSGRHIEFLGKNAVQYQTTQLPNGNGTIPRQEDDATMEQTQSVSMQSDDLTGRDTSQLPLYSSTPVRRSTCVTPLEGGKPFFITFKSSTPPKTVAPTNSGGCNVPPNSLALNKSISPASGNGSAGVRRSSGGGGSTSSGNVSNASNGSKKPTKTNFTKHSTSIDGICLLAEEESSAATITPTSETDVTMIAAFNPQSSVALKKNALSASNSTAKPPYAINTPSTSRNNSNSSKQTNINNNNSNLKKTATATVTTTTAAASSTPSETTVHSSKETKVPTLGSNSLLRAASAAMPMSASSSDKVSKNLHRRPVVDPNG